MTLYMPLKQRNIRPPVPKNASILPQPSLSFITMHHVILTGIGPTHLKEPPPLIQANPPAVIQAGLIHNLIDSARYWVSLWSRPQETGIVFLGLRIMSVIKFYLDYLQFICSNFTSLQS